MVDITQALHHLWGSVSCNLRGGKYKPEYTVDYLSREFGNPTHVNRHAMCGLRNKLYSNMKPDIEPGTKYGKEIMLRPHLE